MQAHNHVYIATSLDGYIADKNGGLAWLDNIENPEQDDMGYGDANTFVVLLQSLFFVKCFPLHEHSSRPALRA